MSSFLGNVGGVEVQAFYGGADRGRCLAIDIPRGDDAPRELTFDDVAKLADILNGWLVATPADFARAMNAPVDPLAGIAMSIDEAKRLGIPIVWAEDPLLPLLQELVEVIERAPAAWQAGVTQTPIDSSSRILTAAVMDRVSDIGKRIGEIPPATFSVTDAGRAALAADPSTDLEGGL